MNEPELAPLEDDLRAWVEGARGDPPVPEVSRERLRTRLGDLMATPPAGTAVAPRVPGWLRNAGLLVVGGLVGAVAHATLSSPRVETRVVERVVVSPPPSSAPASSTSAAEAPPSDSESASAPASPAVSAPHKAALVPPTPDGGPAGDEGLARERSLLEVARSALARGDSASALAAAGKHAQSFPRGQLTEEREAIAIQALVQSGRRGEARARADQFRRQFPHGLFLPVVDAALGSISQ